MDSTIGSGAQAPASPSKHNFPQLLREKLTGRSKQEAADLILQLFDRNAIDAHRAEQWLMAVESLHPNY